MKITFILLLIFTSFNIKAKDAYNFSLKGHDGKKYNLKDYRGKTVILEWFNHGCPFVRKHYDSNNMQALQEKYIKEGGDIVWFSINSSNVGNQGYLKDFDRAKEIRKKEGMKSSALLIDTDGKVGQKYGAVTTPHIFIINKMGKIIYDGAIDNNPSVSLGKADINYIDKTLASIDHSATAKLQKNKPYGCSVKY